MFKLGIDIGYGLVKGINERGDRVRFPSLVAPPYERSLNEAFGVEEERDEIHAALKYPWKSKTDFFVGDLAFNSSQATYAFDNNKIDHPTTHALIATAASMLTVGVNEPIHLITGLPLDYYKTQKAQFEETLRNFTVDVQMLAGKFNGHSTTVTFDRVTVYLQGGASIYPCLMDIHGMPKRKDLLGSGELLAVVNLGFYTMDVIVFECGKKFKPRNDLSFSYDRGVGMVELRKMAEQAFFDKTQTRLPLPQIEALMRKGGKTTFQGRTVDISDDMKSHKAILSGVCLDQIKTKWGTQKDFIHTVFFGGGGALDLRDNLQGFHYNQEIIKDSQFADAIGYLIYGRLEEYKEKKLKTV